MATSALPHPHCHSLRHTYICLRFLEGADIHQVTKNFRTSVEMIEKFYGPHLKNDIDASAVTVRQAEPESRRLEQEQEGSICCIAYVLPLRDLTATL